MIQRVQWTCPICNRRYAIPATAPTPSRCPQCRELEQVRSQKPASSAEIAQNAHEDAGNEPMTSEAISALAAIQLEVAEEAARGPIAATTTVRHPPSAFRTLNAMSLVYTALAALAVVGGFGGLFYELRAALAMEPTPARTIAIFEAIGSLCAGLVAGVVFFTIRELILLLLDIEESVRGR